jgi:hypothetical protein
MTHLIMGISLIHSPILLGSLLGFAGHRAARRMKAVDDCTSLTFWVRKVPTTLSITLPPQDNCKDLTPNTPLQYKERQHTEGDVWGT